MKRFHSRPTTDFAKEGLFNILDHSILLKNSSVLDLFSGTGNISYEFISRGSLFVHSVDLNFKSVQFIKKTSHELGIEKHSHRVTKSEAHKFIENTEGRYDIIFADPPFDFQKYEELIVSINDYNRLQSNGLLVVEHAKKVNISAVYGYQKSHTFGHVCFSFFNFDFDE